jgi:hypothetical protein
MTCYRLWPLVKDTIKRSHTLVLKARGETISDLFGYSKESSIPGSSDYSGRVILGPAQLNTPKASPLTSCDSNQITKLPMLEDLTLELTDRTYLFSFPFLPNLRRLTLSRTFASPHIVLPLSSDVLEPPKSGSTWYSNIDRNQSQPPIFPSLESLVIDMPNLNIFSLHQFLHAQAPLLTSFELQTTADIMMLYDRPQGLINLPQLRILKIYQITALLSSHIECWSCPVLEELHISLPSRLPCISKFDVGAYPLLKTLVFTYPTDESELSLDQEQEKVIEEQNLATCFLLSMLRALPELTNLVVNGWNFRGAQEEVDWVRSMIPKRERPAGTVEGSKMDEVPGLKARQPSPIKPRLSVLCATITKDGLLFRPDGEPWSFSSSEDGSPTNSPDKKKRYTGIYI